MFKKNTKRYQRGMALPVVLWIFLLLSLMFSGYGYSIRTETAMTRQIIEVTKTRAAAEAGVQYAITQLMTDDEDSFPGKVYSHSFNGIHLRYAMINESGRIDLNAASENLLDILFQTIASSTEEAAQLLDSLLDWRDNDAERRPFGAEDEGNVALAMPYAAADTELKSVDELMLVQGMTPELFDILRGMVTVHSEAEKINLSQAPAELLLALAGLKADAIAEKKSDQQQFNHAELVEVLTANLPADLLSNQVNDTYHIEVEASMKSGTKSRLSIILRLVDTAQKPYTVLSWKEVEKLDFIL